MNTSTVLCECKYKLCLRDNIELRRSDFRTGTRKEDDNGIFGDRKRDSLIPGSMISFPGELGLHLANDATDCPGRTFRVIRTHESRPFEEVRCDTCNGTYVVVGGLFVDAVFSADDKASEFPYAVKFLYRFHLGNSNSANESAPFWFRRESQARGFFANVGNNLALSQWRPNHPSEVLDQASVQLYHKPDDGDWERLVTRQVPLHE